MPSLLYAGDLRSQIVNNRENAAMPRFHACKLLMFNFIQEYLCILDEVRVAIRRMAFHAHINRRSRRWNMRFLKCSHMLPRIAVARVALDTNQRHRLILHIKSTRLLKTNRMAGKAGWIVVPSSVEKRGIRLGVVGGLPLL